MKNFIRQLDDVSRRDFCCMAAKTFLGLSVLPLSFSKIAAAAPETRGTGTPATSKAVNCIYLYMGGGMSHIDTFDPKPGNEAAGPVQAISTNADGIQISEYLPKMAQQMDKVSIVRSLSSNQGAHHQGWYFMHTSYPEIGTIVHPSMGAWIMELSGRTNDKLPGNVSIGGGGGGVGFMPARHAPLVIGDPAAGLQDSKLPEGVTPGQFQSRLKLAETFDRTFRQRYPHKQVEAYGDMYQDAVTLMTSKDLEAFDISREKPAVREAYGENHFGRGCLLARRLVEHNVRFIEVGLGGWDTHYDNFGNVAIRSNTLDQALAALLADLGSRGLLENTLVVLATEFGRTPGINVNAGRDHYPSAFCGILAGAGIKAGYAHGKTDETAAQVVENKVEVPDFNATIAHAIGLDIEKVIFSPSQRPFTVAHKGKPVMDLFQGS